MSTRSRSCPQCAGPLDIEGKCRACAAPASGESEELVAKAEALFSSYLSARIVRARRAAKAAKIEALRDPRNRDKADAAQAADDEALRLQAQLVVHTRARTETAAAKPASVAKDAGAGVADTSSDHENTTAPIPSTFLTAAEIAARRSSGKRR